MCSYNLNAAMNFILRRVNPLRSGEFAHSKDSYIPDFKTDFWNFFFLLVPQKKRNSPNVTQLLAASILAICLFPVAAQTQTPQDAITLEHQGKLDDAAHAWEAITRRNPHDAAAFASLGVVLSKQQKYAEAATAYKKALVLNPHLPGIPLNLGLAEFKQGHFSAAIVPFKTALAASPSSTQARVLLSFSYYGSQRFRDAARELKLAIKADPENLELRQALAQSCLWAKDYSCAQQEFQALVEKDPNSANAHMLLGEAYDGLSEKDKAIHEFEIAAKAAPQEPNVHFGLGYLYWKSHRYEEAKKEFEAELANDPKHAQAWAYLGDMEMKTDPDAALPLLRKAIALQPNVRVAYMDLGVIMAERKQYPDAVAAFQRAIELDPNEPDAHYRLGRLYRSMGKTAESDKEFAKVKSIHQKSEEDVARKMSTAPPALSGMETK
jgi:tetratricopeptide (TPR) repeat protein